MNNESNDKNNENTVNTAEETEKVKEPATEETIKIKVENEKPSFLKKFGHGVAAVLTSRFVTETAISIGEGAGMIAGMYIADKLICGGAMFKLFIEAVRTTTPSETTVDLKPEDYTVTDIAE